MAAYNTLIQYILPFLAGVVCLFLIFLTRKGHLRSNGLLAATLLYLADITALTVFQFTLYTREVLLNEISVAGVFRVFDYALYALLPLLWLRLQNRMIYGPDSMPDEDDADFLSDREIRSDRWLRRFMLGGGLFWTTALIVYTLYAGLLMDKGYHIEDRTSALLYHALEITFTVVTVTLLSAYERHAWRRIAMRPLRIFSLLSTLTLCGYFCYTLWDTRNIGDMRDVTWADEPIDLTGWFFFALNVLLIFFLYMRLVPRFSDAAPKAAKEAGLTETARFGHAGDSSENDVISRRGAYAPGRAGTKGRGNAPDTPGVQYSSDAPAEDEAQEKRSVPTRNKMQKKGSAPDTPGTQNSDSVPSAGSARKAGTPEVTGKDALCALSQFGLTERELEVAALVIDGETNAEIGEALYISLNTVKSHLKNIFRKCHVSSRMELLHLAALRAGQQAVRENERKEN